MGPHLDDTLHAIPEWFIATTPFFVARFLVPLTVALDGIDRELSPSYNLPVWCVNLPHH